MQVGVGVCGKMHCSMVAIADKPGFRKTTVGNQRVYTSHPPHLSPQPSHKSSKTATKPTIVTATTSASAFIRNFESGRGGVRVLDGLGVAARLGGKFNICV